MQGARTRGDFRDGEPPGEAVLIDALASLGMTERARGDAVGLKAGETADSELREFVRKDACLRGKGG